MRLQDAGKIAGSCQPVRRAVRQGGAAGFLRRPGPGCQAIEGKNELEPIVEAYAALRQSQEDQKEARELLAGETDPEMKELCQEQFQTAKETEAQLEQELKLLLLPKDPNDEKKRHCGNPRGRRR